MHFIKRLASCICCKKDGIEFLETMPDYNLGQKIVDKFTKLSKTDFSVECFIGDFLRFFAINVKVFLLGGRLVTSHKIQAFHRFS